MDDRVSFVTYYVMARENYWLISTRGHSDLQMTSKVASDLKFKHNCLNNMCSNTVPEDPLFQINFQHRIIFMEKESLPKDPAQRPLLP